MKLIIVMLLIAITLGGCICTQWGCMNAKFDRTDKLSAPFEPNGVFILAVHNGSIKITGRQQNQCEITAVVQARAATDDKARLLAEKVKIELVPTGKQLEVKTTEPENLCGNQSVSVSFEVVLPIKTTLDLTSHNGSITLSNITDQIKAVTHNGNFDAKGICGKTNLTTHNGNVSIGCIKSRTNTDVSVVTHNGNIGVELASDISAKLDAQTYNGLIKSTVPITTLVTGKELKGTIGTGDGQISLRTHNGCINIVPCGTKINHTCCGF